MAIVFEQPKKKINWFGIMTAIFSVVFVSALVYYLFFAPAPKIETVLPPALEKTNQISDLQFTDPSPVLNSPQFKALKLYVGPPATGTLGRPNPFLPA
jgi:hypothetical protein